MDSIEQAIEQTSVDSEIAIMETSKGKITLGFFPDVAPLHVEQIKTLAKDGFYDGILFHRVIPNFVIQVGDPGTKDPNTPRQLHGTGGSDLPDIKAEFNDRPHVNGTLSMARAMDPDSANSQFFVCHGRVPHLDNQYTVFGQVIDGLDVVDAIVNSKRDGGDNPIDPVKIESMTVVAREEA